MIEFSRYAVYYAPPADDPLAVFGAGWLGWNAVEGALAQHPEIAALPAPVERITATPRKYGFHGTLKPPFRLTGDAATLSDAVEALAREASHRLGRLGKGVQCGGLHRDLGDHNAFP